MSKNTNHSKNGNSDVYQQTKGPGKGNTIAVTSTPGGGHTHIAYDKNTGEITHSDITIKTEDGGEIKIDVNPNVANSLSSFFHKD